MSRHVVLDTIDDAFIDGLIATGRFDTAQDAFRAALRLLNLRETRLAELRDAWDEGCESADWQSADMVFDDLSRRFASDPQAGG